MSEPLEIHKHDQLLAATRQMAAMIVAYYRALIEEGMDPADALVLTVARQTDFWNGCGEE